MPRILWINPIATADYDRALQEWINTAKRPETEVDVVSLARGTRHTEYQFYETLVMPDILHRLKRAEKDGYAAAVLGCFYDPGLRVAREITDRMVVAAPAEASMLIAAALGHRFSILVGRKKWIPRMHENVVNYGLETRLASFESVDLGVEDFQKDTKETERRLTEAARRAIEEKLAEVIILGCGLQYGFYEVLQKKLGVPVIDVVLAALKHAELGIELRQRFGWGHSIALRLRVAADRGDQRVEARRAVPRDEGLVDLRGRPARAHVSQAGMAASATRAARRAARPVFGREPVGKERRR